MKAIRFHSYGPPDCLRYEEIPRPQPGTGEVLIRVRAAGVNPIDGKLRAGLLRDLRPITLPFTPGSDFAGTVEEAGDGDSGFQRDQPVFGLARGSYAEYALAPAADIQPIPPGLGFDQAAAAPLGLLTAWYALEDAGVTAGQRVLVQGAAGGVGLFLVQLAKLRGAQVLGTAATNNLGFVKQLGADEAIDHTKPAPRNLLDGIDVVIDAVGGLVLRQSIEWVRPGGTVISLAEPVADSPGPRGISVRFCRRGPARALGSLVRLLGPGGLFPVVRGSYPLDQAAQVHVQIQEGHGRGHFVLVPGGLPMNPGSLP